MLLSLSLLGSAFARAVDVHVQSSDVRTSPVKQVLAQAVIDAPAEALFSAISDVERYASFMPYVIESTVVKRDSGSVVNYQRLSFNLLVVSERHYAIRLRNARGRDAEGRATYLIQWTLAHDAPLPQHSSAVAVPTNDGFWYLRDLGTQPPQTQVTYCVHTDPGGQLPSWIVNQVNVEAVPRVFEAVRTAARGNPYATARPDASPAEAVLVAPTTCASDT